MFIKDLWERVKEFILKAAGSRKFYAFFAATFFLCVGLLSPEIWLAVAGIYTASIVAEKIGAK